jgi:hypothetical protein
VNRFRIVPRLAGEPGRVHLLRRTVGGELLIAVGIFGLAGTLAGLPPAAQARMHEAEAPAGLVVSGNDFATSIRVRLTIRPGTAGPNDFHVRVEDYDSGQPVDATRVALRFTRPGVGPALLELHKDAGEQWTGQGTVMAVQGSWQVTVIIQAPPRVSRCHWTCGSAAPPPRRDTLHRSPPRPIGAASGSPSRWGPTRRNSAPRCLSCRHRA